jgi:hypothetical protein
MWWERQKSWPCQNSDPGLLAYRIVPVLCSPTLLHTHTHTHTHMLIILLHFNLNIYMENFDECVIYLRASLLFNMLSLLYYFYIKKLLSYLLQKMCTSSVRKRFYLTTVTHSSELSLVKVYDFFLCLRMFYCPLQFKHSLPLSRLSDSRIKILWHEDAAVLRFETAGLILTYIWSCLPRKCNRRLCF